MKPITVILGALFALFLLDRYRAGREPIAVRCDGGEEPQSEDRVHIDGPDCWCEPTLFFDGGDEFGNVWVHKGNGEELPPTNVLASAVADAVSGYEGTRRFRP